MLDFSKDTEIQRIVSEKRRQKSSIRRHRRRINSTLSGIAEDRHPDMQRMFHTYHGQMFQRLRANSIDHAPNEDEENNSLTQPLIDG